MLRLLLATGAISLWLAFLVMGWTAGGALHLLLVAGLVAFPWRALRAGDDDADDDDDAEGEPTAAPAERTG